MRRYEHACGLCGAALPSDAPNGACPQCSLRAALEFSETHPTSLSDSGLCLREQAAKNREVTLRRRFIVAGLPQAFVLAAWRSTKPAIVSSKPNTWLARETLWFGA